MSDNEGSVPTEGIDYGDTMVVWPSTGRIPGGDVKPGGGMGNLVLIYCQCRARNLLHSIITETESGRFQLTDKLIFNVIRFFNEFSYYRMDLIQ